MIKPGHPFRLATTLAFIWAALVLVAWPAGAADEPDQEPESRNGVAFFMGATDDDQEVAFTLGVDYEYRFARRFGLGGLIDFALGDLRSFVLGVPVFFHPSERWKLFAAPGFERRESDNNFLVRLGAGYSFDVGPVDLEPSFQVDFVDEDEVSEVFILGVALVWEF